MNISLIAAISKNFVIGYKNKIPWYLPNDLKWFKSKTINKSIIMGRITWQSINNTLPMRTNIVVSKNRITTTNNDVIWANSINNAIISTISSLQDQKNQEIMVIGGEKIYQQMLFYANKLYLTHVNCSIVGDTYFPKYTMFQHWKTIFKKKYLKDEKHSHDFCFEILIR